ncbi:MAG: DNA mismatch repair protein MutS [Anaerolineales bacterium]|nr:DNA mismatch repair protein MutS [Anaerolineales bacterium]
MSSTDEVPFRRQYLEAKRQHPGAIMLFRMGDFYETFDGDAELVARELDLILTRKAAGKQGYVPMAGLPHHAAESYIARLIAKGYHVAICEQTSTEAVKGLFKREVVRVVTPGTVVEPGMLDAQRNNYLAAVVFSPTADRAAVAHADITTGEFAVTQLSGGDTPAAVRHELLRLRPAELLLPDGSQPSAALEAVPAPRTPLAAWKFDGGQARNLLLDHFKVETLAAFGLDGSPLMAGACGAILAYVKDTQPAALTLLSSLRTYALDDYMTLDAATRRNLELTETLRGGQVKGSLLGVLDQTITAMGARLLRLWVTQPLLDRTRIEARLDQVAAFHAEGLARAETRALLKPLADLERITNRVVGGSAHPRDLVALRATLAAVPAIAERLRAAAAAAAGGPGAALAGPAGAIDPCEPVHDLLARAIADDPPAVLARPGIIRPGYSAELDGIQAAARHAREWIAGLEKVERERTGLRGLKVSYNKVFGYYLELSRGQSDQAPENYIRKQTLVNAERYITPELKEYETLVLNADERILEIETRLFREICGEISRHVAALLATARALAQLDVAAGLAEVAGRQAYVRPVFTAGGEYTVRGGRHPVVEQYLPEAERFVPNDIVFEPGECVRVITGPNMAGKSTYLRQAAIITLMAQMGSFVPAASARLGLVDRIFTRIGAQDEIHAGQSTFMVEMVETANILHHATPHSLLVLDEIGRGTSTYDGLSLAWAIVEYLHNHPRLRAKTLFATHYHELTDLATLLPGVRNYNVAVAEDGATDRVIFLHRIVPGGADRSYGIHVAHLAGLPRPVVNRAQEIMAQLEAGSGRAAHLPPPAGEAAPPAQQMALFAADNPLLDELRALDANTMTPVEALNKLFEWQARFKQT